MKERNPPPPFVAGDTVRDAPVVLTAGQHLGSKDVSKNRDPVVKVVCDFYHIFFLDATGHVIGNLREISHPDWTSSPAPSGEGPECCRE